MNNEDLDGVAQARKFLHTGGEDAGYGTHTTLLAGIGWALVAVAEELRKTNERW